jgi:hypothetical protein
MNTKRFLPALIALTLMLPLLACGCRHKCCNDTRTLAPPPAPCCNTPAPPPAYIPPPGQ